MTEELTVNLAAELLSGIDGQYNDYYDISVGASGNENVVTINLTNFDDDGESFETKSYRFAGEEVHG